MDLALLGTAMVLPGKRSRRLATAAAAVAGVTVLDVIASKEHSRRNGNSLEGAFELDLRVRKSVIIDRPAQGFLDFGRKLVEDGDDGHAAAFRLPQQSRQRGGDDEEGKERAQRQEGEVAGVDEAVVVDADGDPLDDLPRERVF